MKTVFAFCRLYLCPVNRFPALQKLFSYMKSHLRIVELLYLIQSILFTSLPCLLPGACISPLQLWASLSSEGRHLMETCPLDLLSHNVWLLVQLLSEKASDGGRLRHSTKKYNNIIRTYFIEVHFC